MNQQEPEDEVLRKLRERLASWVDLRVIGQRELLEMAEQMGVPRRCGHGSYTEGCATCESIASMHKANGLGEGV
jgi:hypothetical protein